MRPLRRIALCAALAALPACYDTPEPDCAFQCGVDDACPDEYGCASDGWCKRIDLPDDHVCSADLAAAPFAEGSEALELVPHPPAAEAHAPLGAPARALPGPAPAPGR